MRQLNALLLNILMVAHQLPLLLVLVLVLGLGLALEERIALLLAQAAGFVVLFQDGVAGQGLGVAFYQGLVPGDEHLVAGFEGLLNGQMGAVGGAGREVFTFQR